MSLQPASLDTVPNQDEKTMAILAQVLQLVGSWIAPLIILIIRRQSRFVSFHALQALLFQILYIVVFFMVLFGAFFLGVLGAVAQSAVNESAPPIAILVMMPLIWMCLIGFGITNLVVGIVYAIKASRGEWAEYPVLGGIARRILHIGPGGAPVSA
jgi:uncharacterized membrane protein